MIAASGSELTYMYSAVIGSLSRYIAMCPVRPSARAAPRAYLPHGAHARSQSRVATPSPREREGVATRVYRTAARPTRRSVVVLALSVED